MRIAIKNKVDDEPLPNRNLLRGYQDAILRVQDWFCEQESIDYHTADLITETEKAVLLDFGDRQVWVPKSLFTVHPVPDGLERWQ